MSIVIACYKWVVDEADIRVNSDGSIDISRAGHKISEYDKNAIEAAVELAESAGGTPVGLSFGDGGVQKSLKDALSRGLEKGIWVQSPEGAPIDGAVTARALAAAVRNVEDATLVVLAEGSSDVYARQTAPRVGALLDWPVITSVSQVSVSGNTVTAVRHLGDTLETIEAELPAVISVLPEINHPRIPGLKAVMAAGKKPVETFAADSLGIDLEPLVLVESLSSYSQDRRKSIIEGATVEDQAKALVSALTKEGVL